MKQILFNKEMSKAIIKHLKTQTRRCIDRKLYNDNNVEEIINLINTKQFDLLFSKFKIKPTYQIDEVLWLREPVKISHIDLKTNTLKFKYSYPTDETEYKMKIPQRYMESHLPQWMLNKKSVPNGCLKEMCRTHLTITNIKAELIQDISHDDVYAEGFDTEWYNKKNGNFRHWYIKLWDSLTKKGYKISDNPLVFVYEFSIKQV